MERESASPMWGHPKLCKTDGAAAALFFCCGEDWGGSVVDPSLDVTLWDTDIVQKEVKCEERSQMDFQ
ncbi:putative Stonustoxin subunit beta protein, partial [Naja naja]